MGRQATTMTEGSTMTTNQKYVALQINGNVVQTDADTVLQFTMDDGRVIEVQADTAPEQPSYKKAPGFSRTTGEVSNVYHIVPVSRVWINGEPSSRVIAIAYSDVACSLITLYPAVDVLRNQQDSRTKVSEVLYRAVDPMTQKTVKAMKVASVSVVSPQTVAEPSVN